MLEAFLITLREGVEAALVVGLLLVLLERSGRRALHRAVYAGLGAAALVSLALGAGFHWLSIDPEDERVEGILLFAATAMVASLVIWMWRMSAGMKGALEARVEGIARRASPARAAAAAFVVTFFMVGREGFETVFFLGALRLTTQSLLVYPAVAAAIFLAVLFGIAVTKGLLRLNLRVFFGATALALLVFAAELAVGGVHEFMEVGWLPSNPRAMQVIGGLLRHNALFTIGIVAILAALAVALVARPRPVGEAEGPERRLALAGRRRERFASAALLLTCLAILTATTVAWRRARPPELAAPKLVQPEGDVIRVARADLADGVLARFALQVDGRFVRFLLLAEEGRPAIATLDACAICGDYGYFQIDDRILCRNCVAEINPVTFGQPGGCNPIPLTAREEGGFVLLDLAELRQAAPIFRSGTLPEAECPVCGMRFVLTGAEIPVLYFGRSLYFCTMPGEPCAERFRREPERYVRP